MTRARTAPHDITRTLRREILGGRIAPDSWVREEDRAERLGVSRTPLREALVELCRQGLLERIPHRGFHCPPLTWDEVKHVYPVLTSLEQLAIRSIPDSSLLSTVDRRRGP